MQIKDAVRDKLCSHLSLYTSFYVQIKDAVRDGLRAVKNTLDDVCVLPGACVCLNGQHATY